MSKSLNYGLGVVLFAAAMGVTGSASAAPPHPCTQANWGEVSVIYTERPGGFIQRIFECSSAGWTLIGVCNQNGCEYY